MIDDVMMDDVMIVATFHWLLLAKRHANHLINSHVIGKLENLVSPKNMRYIFMKEMEHFGPSDRFELRISSIQDGTDTMHA